MNEKRVSLEAGDAADTYDGGNVGRCVRAAAAKATSGVA